ncbi:DMT family transporter [Vibrio rhizosphaerae]|uniref:DMT family transporter n=1 Tax=Vibrio rhizosphaerae TaxID=398736 RepID=A0ABU4IX18_9VIBR|nr:DMT family transporter [Vibrio rhizosphaerae]MDW6093935.1 DMT family transporter [Vibrio rhizosphaerae]
MYRHDHQKLAILAVTISGLIWGILWMPLRALNHNGISGQWSVVLFYVAPFMLLFPVYLFRLRQLLQGGLSLHLPSLLAASGLVLYAESLIHTQVINAMLLYYLTPLWSTLLARYFLREHIGLDRWITMVLAFLGLLVIFKIDSGIPFPQNIGDWMGLASGIIWALAAVSIKKTDTVNTINTTLCYFFWGSLMALALTQLPIKGHQDIPAWKAVYDGFTDLLPVALLLIIPPAMAVLWGASILSPGILGILFMTEISTGSISAAIWSHEPFGLREILGITFISLAGLWEPLRNRQSLADN